MECVRQNFTTSARIRANRGVYRRFTRLLSDIAPDLRQDVSSNELCKEDAMQDRQNTALRTGPTLTQRDRRADTGERRIKMAGEDILISRRVSGIAMMIRVPVSTYRGVALAIRANADGGAHYCLSLAHRDPDLDIVLAETQDGGAIAADWKYWSSTLNLPRLGDEEAETKLCSGEAPLAPRRLGAATLGYRRSRFARRRKLGVASRAEEVFSGEREIVCYE
jgi:hypothetical protein